MTTSEAVKIIQKKFDINGIYAHKIFRLADKSILFDDVARIISEKPRPFVKWVGGKRQLLEQFRRMNLYPPEAVKYNLLFHFNQVRWLYMKWYKKQMDQLKIAKSEAPKSSLDEITKKTSGHTFDARKTSGMKTNISPVMTRNRNRPKTDSK